MFLNIQLINIAFLCIVNTKFFDFIDNEEYYRYGINRIGGI